MTVNRRPLVDVGAGVLCLPGHWHAVEAVNPDGDRSFWLMDPNPQDDHELPIAIPAHEDIGPLPLDVRRRISPVARCGQPTRSGAPCQAAVAHPGATCTRHRTTTEAPS
jgi:hypothetical protein